MDKINGNTLRDMILSGGGNLQLHKQEVNDLNVFPVPDGDTGTNMSMTISSAMAELVKLDGATAGKVAAVTANALLRGARGNSGVILSLLFRGFSKSIGNKEEITAKEFAKAFVNGVAAAYKAVMKPTEGTILTVTRLAGDAAVAAAEDGADVVSMLETLDRVANETLEKTPDMLPVLKEAGVVDSGGRGFTCVSEGMLVFLKAGKIISADTAKPAEAKAAKYAYCANITVIKGENSQKSDYNILHTYVTNKGNATAFTEEKACVKICVETNHPGHILEEAMKYGTLSGVTVESIKCCEKAEEEAPKAKEKKPAKVASTKPFGFVSVAAGTGFKDLMLEIGTDCIVTGGQTMNPSTEDILAAVEQTPSNNVFVFPNNKNIILAAQMVVPLTKKKVYIIPTKTLPEGIAALLAFDQSATAEENVKTMEEAVATVKTGQVTYAVRDSEINGTSIKEGEVMGLYNGGIAAKGTDVENAAFETAKAMVNDETSMITLYFGEEASEEKALSLVDRLQSEFGDAVSVTAINGGQPVYYYVVSVE